MLANPQLSQTAVQEFSHRLLTLEHEFFGNPVTNQYTVSTNPHINDCLASVSNHNGCIPQQPRHPSQRDPQSHTRRPPILQNPPFPHRGPQGRNYLAQGHSTSKRCKYRGGAPIRTSQLQLARFRNLSRRAWLVYSRRMVSVMDSRPQGCEDLLGL